MLKYLAKSLERIFNSFVMESQLVTCAGCSIKNLNSRAKCFNCDGTLQALDSEAEETPISVSSPSLPIGFIETSWYRLAKLIYVLCYLCAFGFVLYGSFSQGRHPSLTFNLTCSNGTEYEVNNANGTFPSIFGVKGFQDICAGRDIGFPSHIDRPNYTTSDYRYRFGYRKAGVFLFFGLLATVLSGELLRRSFLYVNVGVPFFDDLKNVKQFLIKLGKRSKSLFWDGKSR
jgi:hypothetical protein